MFFVACVDAGDSGVSRSSGEAGASNPPATPDAGDSAEDPIVWSAEGVYTGILTSDVTGTTQNLIAFADGWGHTRFVTGSGQYYGFPNSPDFPLTGITSAGHTWPDGSTKSTFSFDRLASNSADLAGTYSGAGGHGTWSLDREPLITDYPEAGQYVLRDDLENIGATFEINGAGIYGSNVDGCIFSGSLLLDGWTFIYSYDISITVENCPNDPSANLDGQYFGMGGLTPNLRVGHEDPLLTIGIDNGEQAIMLVLEKH